MYALAWNIFTHAFCFGLIFRPLPDTGTPEARSYNSTREKEPRPSKVKISAVTKREMSSKAPRGVSTSTRMANNTRTRRQMPCFSVWMSMICRACALSYGGYIDGAVFTVNLPVDLVQSLLPDGLEPIRANGTTHPANLIFCIQTHVGSPFTDFNYDEFILSIPSVQWDDKHKDNYKYRGPFIYLPKLYLNESLPVELGQWWV